MGHGLGLQGLQGLGLGLGLLFSWGLGWGYCGALMCTNQCVSPWACLENSSSSSSSSQITLPVDARFKYFNAVNRRPGQPIELGGAGS